MRDQARSFSDDYPIPSVLLLVLMFSFLACRWGPVETSRRDIKRIDAELAALRAAVATYNQGER